MPLLKDVHPFIAEILDGKHDEILNAVEQAVRVRKAQTVRSSGLRPGARVRVTESAAERAADMVGRVGKVDRVNPKTVTVTLDPLDENDFALCWRFPASWLEVSR